MVNDQEATLFKLNKLCNTNHDLFSKIRMLKKKLPIILSFAREIIESFY
jgi:hypothetical protein